ncbi:hypothetical protein AB6T38_01615 [Aliiglaciecola sp. SL4]|uniref:hypothetical protein n=1 Tax=Aliiglaciecola sp. SL4 TaxID=3239806 RepID=UPI00355BAB4A
MVNPIDTNKVDDADYVNSIIESGNIQKIIHLLSSVEHFSNSVIAEMTCEKFFEHPAPSVRLATVSALINIAESNVLAFEMSAKNFFDQELIKTSNNSILSINEKEVLELYRRMEIAMEWSFSHPKLKKVNCGELTPWAYLLRDELDTCTSERLYDLSQSDWDYSKPEKCGQSVDNVDGMVTIYCCPNCQTS